MTGLGWGTLADLPGYHAGVIMVGLARCISMIVIWNHFARSMPEYSVHSLCNLGGCDLHHAVCDI